ncbi:MAG: hypothetical protein LC667_17865 [Thioalkalivibrio sp.]|nr:hypothetical protein [Thioalkalivibrio sp.]
MKLFRLSALVVALSLAACTSSSPNPALSDPAAPAFDGGAGLGSGNHKDEDDISATGDDTTAASDTTGTADRGGNGLGSGH